MKLYELSNQMRGLQALMDDPETELDLADTLDALEGDLQVKAEGLLSYVSNLGSDVEAINTEIKRLTVRKKVITNKQDSLREYLRHNMDIGGIDKITCPLFTITLRKATQAVQVADMDALPEKYRRITVSADKAAIKSDLKAGKEIPGCSMVDGKRGLLIK